MHPLCDLWSSLWPLSLKAESAKMSDSSSGGVALKDDGSDVEESIPTNVPGNKRRAENQLSSGAKKKAKKLNKSLNMKVKSHNSVHQSMLIAVLSKCFGHAMRTDLSNFCKT